MTDYEDVQAFHLRSFQNAALRAASGGRGRAAKGAGLVEAASQILLSTSSRSRTRRSSAVSGRCV